MTAELVAIGALVATAAAYAGWRLWRALAGRGCCPGKPGGGSPCDGCSGACQARTDRAGRGKVR